MRTNEIKKWQEKIKRKDMENMGQKYIHDFQQYETIRSFGESIYTCKINTDEAEMDQSNLLKELVEFNDKSRPRTAEGKDKKRNTYKSTYALYESRKLILNAFRSGIFPIKETQGQGLKILIGNASENLLNEIRQIIYSLYRAKEITKKVYNNIMNLIIFNTKMDTIFMNSKNSKKSDPHRLLLNLTDKIDLRRKDEYIALSNLSIYYTWKIF